MSLYLHTLYSLSSCLWLMRPINVIPEVKGTYFGWCNNVIHEVKCTFFGGRYNVIPEVKGIFLDGDTM